MSSRPIDFITSLWPLFVGLATVIAGVHLSLTSLRTERPLTPVPSQIGSHAVAAKLWQDPFEAVRLHEVTHGHGHDEDHVHMEQHGSDPEQEGMKAHTISEMLKPLKFVTPQTFQVMLVCVRSENYAEDREWRIRTRRAVHESLAEEGYAPRSTESIGYLEHQMSVFSKEELMQVHGWSKENNNYPRLLATLPYEWFMPRPSHVSSEVDQNREGSRTDNASQPNTDATSTQPVLVLWIRDQDMSEDPLLRIYDIFSSLENQLGELELDTSAQLRVLGPATSTTLAHVLDSTLSDQATNKEYLRFGEAQPRILLHGVIAKFFHDLSILSPSSTTPLDILWTASDLNPRQHLLNKLRNKLTRCIGEDRALAKQLVHELSLRRVDLSDETSLCLICEEDSIYGRTWPELFVDARAHELGEEEEAPTDIRTVWYLRGIDGRISKEDAQRLSDTATDSPQEDDRDLTQERPVGRHQLDYVRRIAARMSADDRPAPKAIGILGSDVYDKLLLIQAMKEQFPDAILFTTDLDARLFHVSQQPWTRHLLVASHYGLEINDRELVFRDSYQTATYVAVKKALGLPAVGQPSNLMFEIGRGQAVRLPTGEHPTDDNPTLEAPSRTKAGHRQSTQIWGIVAFGIGAISLALHYSPFARNLFRLDDDREKSWPLLQWSLTTGFFLCITILFIALLSTAYNNDQESGGEPFSWTNGISAWPSIFVRYFAFVLSIGFAALTCQAIHSNNRRLIALFGFDRNSDCRTPAGQPEDAAANSRLRRIVHRIMLKLKSLFGEFYSTSIDSWQPPLSENKKSVDGKQLWHNYLDLGRTRFRCRRVVSMAAVMLLIYVGLLYVIGDPPIRARGDVAWRLAYVLKFLSLISFFLLTFLVIDSQKMFAKFIDNLARHPTEYDTPVMSSQLIKDKELPMADLRDWLDVQVIGQSTHQSESLVYYPFVALFVILVASVPFFDVSRIPPAEATVLTICAAYVVVSSFTLHSQAQKARRWTLARIQERILRASSDSEKEVRSIVATETGTQDENHRTTNVECQASDRPLANRDQLELLAAEVRRFRRGAFAPLTDNPVIRAILIPSGGITLLGLLELWLNS